MGDEPPCGSVIYLFHTFPASRGIFSLLFVEGGVGGGGIETRQPAERGLCHSRPQSPFLTNYGKPSGSGNES